MSQDIGIVENISRAANELNRLIMVAYQDYDLRVVIKEREELNIASDFGSSGTRAPSIEVRVYRWIREDEKGGGS